MVYTHQLLNHFIPPRTSQSSFSDIFLVHCEPIYTPILDSKDADPDGCLAKKMEPGRFDAPQKHPQNRQVGNLGILGSCKCHRFAMHQAAWHEVCSSDRSMEFHHVQMIYL
jgi:hypothetical protein